MLNSRLTKYNELGETDDIRNEEFSEPPIQQRVRRVEPNVQKV